MKKIKLRIHQITVLIKYCYYWLYCKVFRIHNHDVWLISERGDEARDNGLAFFRYLLEHHPEVNFKYVITKNSADLQKFPDLNRIVYYGSKEHYILFITAGKLISTHIMGFSPEFRIFNKLDKWGFIKIHGKKIFLGHGVDKDQCEGLHFGNVKLDLLLAGAEPEYDYKVATYGHPNGAVQYTGYPRFDNLNSRPKKQILFMPTWRMNLFYCPNIEEFKKTTYFENWNNLLNDKKLIDFLTQAGYELYFYPHYEIQPYIKAFKVNSDIITIADFDHYDVQTLLIESQLLVTDYSSIFFDFAYMNKPLIYYHFDYQAYRQNHFKEGYFSYPKDGFGPIKENHEEVTKAIIKYVTKDFKVENKYQKNRNRFFTLSHGENSQRTYEAIKKLDGDESR